MNGGSIKDNKFTYIGFLNNGGGVYIDNGTFIMNNGIISGNSVPSSYGGGVYVNKGTFTMNNGSINGNTAYCGGGVSVNNSTFTMLGGTISGNSADNGGGVYCDSGAGGIFTKSGTGGIIYGSNAPEEQANRATNRGHVVYASSGSSINIRNSTARVSQILDTRKWNEAGIWE